MTILFESKTYIVEEHPLAPMPFWVINKHEINPLHAVKCFYDLPRAVDFALLLEERSSLNAN